MIARSSADAMIAPMHCTTMYMTASFEGIFPLRSIAIVIAGLM
jgi:hypothetical protein